jgi:hypothetical protein
VSVPWISFMVDQGWSTQSQPCPLNGCNTHRPGEEWVPGLGIDPRVIYCTTDYVMVRAWLSGTDSVRRKKSQRWCNAA